MKSLWIRLFAATALLLSAACSSTPPQLADSGHAYWTDSYNPAHESNGGLCGYSRTCP